MVYYDKTSSPEVNEKAVDFSELIKREDGIWVDKDGVPVEEANPTESNLPQYGRPKGAKQKKPTVGELRTFSAHKRLEELGFDPIEETIKMIHATDFKIMEMEEQHGTKQAIAQLWTTREKLINNLMRYGYAQAPNKTEMEVTEKKPLQIIMPTLNDEDEGKGEPGEVEE